MEAIIFFSIIAVLIILGVAISTWLYRNGAFERQVIEYW